jgi:sugar phosphate isomerase/epimerase
MLMSLMHTLSIQLYSARLAGSLAEQLDPVVAAGYTNVETYEGLYDDVEGLGRALEERGLSSVSGHFDFLALESEPNRMIAIARTLGIRVAIASWLKPEDRPTDTAGWRDLNDRISRVSSRLRAQGIGFAWHNHDFEFQRLSDGTRPIEVLTDSERLSFELDLAWIARAGENPGVWLRRLRGRVAAIHVNDLAATDESVDEDGWADVGSGVLPWVSLWPQALEAGARLAIAEHDAPADFARFAHRSAAAIRRFRGQD